MKTLHTLGDVASHLAMLEVRCSRCTRHGRLSVARLISEHGPDMPIKAATDPMTTNCPNQDAAQLRQRCDPYFPDLVRLFGRPG